MSDLFSERGAPRPLADRLRPTRLADLVGQPHLVGPDGVLTRTIQAGELGSLIFWGPPGTGKTSAARLLAGETALHFEQLSAIFSGVAELRKVFEAARARRARGQGTFLFVDEIHRFNRAQQDAFLPVMEDGTVTLVGATTENPSFALNAALLSRARVLVFRRLDEAALAEEVARAARSGEVLSAEALQALLQRRAPVYDKGQEGHYNLVSALHKTIRGSDPDAALYYLARMLGAGEDRLFIARRLVRAALEDVGLADPQALVVANAAKEAFDFLGSPEGELALAEATLYLATAPKSNAVYTAYKRAVRAAEAHGSLSPPRTLLNAPTGLMRRMGYGEGYRYDHDELEAFSGQDYWPEGMEPLTLYEPTPRGQERPIAERLDQWRRRRAERRGER